MAQLKPHHTPVRLQTFTDEPIAVLDDDGRWNASFAPGLDDKALVKAYEDLVMSRLLAERLEKMLRTGKISFTAPTEGHEAAYAGIAHAMRCGHDWLFPYYRDTGLAAIVSSPEDILAQQQATLADRNKGRQMPCHPGSDEDRIYTVCSSIASHVPPAVGTAMAAQAQGSDEVVIATFGDGATSEGDWAAAVNLAAVQHAPVVFVCENNGYAISVSQDQQTRSKHIADKARAYDIPGYCVDGMDPMAVFHVVHQAIEDARAGHGPALVELCLYRYGAHSSADDDSIYRSREEVEYWKGRDPLPRMRRYLESRELWDSERDEQLYEHTRTALTEAVDKTAAAGTPPVDWLFEDVFADMPWHLREQRELVRAELAAEK